MVFYLSLPPGYHMLFGGGQVEAKSANLTWRICGPFSDLLVGGKMQALLLNGSCGSHFPCVDGRAHAPHVPHQYRPPAARGYFV
jgi:hypothetical protein